LSLVFLIIIDLLLPLDVDLNLFDWVWWLDRLFIERDRIVVDSEVILSLKEIMGSTTTQREGFSESKREQNSEKVKSDLVVLAHHCEVISASRIKF
jgi:hypothetical protein